MKSIHLLQAVHAARAGDKNGCRAKGTKAVAVDIEKVTCTRCKHWYWHHEGLRIAPHVEEEMIRKAIAEDEECK